MVAAFDFCCHGRDGASPSIDTAMHGLVGGGHVDHLHPDAGIAIATATDGEQLTKAMLSATGWPGCHGGVLAFSSVSTSPRFSDTNPRQSVSSWAATASPHGVQAATRRGQLTLGSSRQPESYLDEHGAPEPFGETVDSRRPLSPVDRRAKAASLAPFLRVNRIAGTTSMVGHFSDPPEVLEFLASGRLFALAELGTSCPDHFLRTKVKPWFSICPLTAPVEECTHRLRRPPRSSTAPTTPPITPGTHRRTLPPYGEPIRPSCWFQGLGCSPTGRTSRPPASPESSISTPSTSCAAPSPVSPTPPSPSLKSSGSNIGRSRRPNSRRLSSAEAASPAASPWSPERASGIGRAVAAQLASEGACVVIADLDADKAAAVARELGSPDIAVGLPVDVTDARAVRGNGGTPASSPSAASTS